ncbi:MULTISPECIES: MarR family winged helix-turn-helix transcriptional regulator [unclassified Paraburkholderia]|uniref:MarR family winged helix-turn-helix transcriptional regulator n=1 Tax=unclassified Paraburkholderia TaxID=2615204 RepID=UPI001980A8E6|nr:MULTISPECIES: MarR family winged helix-turn-helix transcriptional regulator [unclassified Paraburkholderia]MBN3855357.1 winged helix-turn-helix transcriptional regulator [Paraburkholderia sp. Ac-20340]
MSNDSDTRRRAEAVLQFNRFYRTFLGAQQDDQPASPFSLTEIRVLRELYSGGTQTSATLARMLSLDSGYLSRILASFARRHLIARAASQADARRSFIYLTETGRETYASLKNAAIGGLAERLGKLSAAEQEELIGAMQVVQRLLG